jgi:zinc D-Ala-D-Ala carboxypeptidase
MTPNFALEEFTRTSTGLKNEPSESAKVRLLRLANVMEVVREICGDKPISISSGYRSAEVNKAVGGSKTSAHLRGDAVDFMVKGLSAKQTCQMIMDYGVKIKFDQLIEEYHKGAEWVHLGLSDNPRQEYLIYKNGKYTRVE